MVEGLRGKKIVHVAVGALHCLAVTDSGQVRSWRAGRRVGTGPCVKGVTRHGVGCVSHSTDQELGRVCLVLACVCPVVSEGDTRKVSPTNACCNSGLSDSEVPGEV